MGDELRGKVALITGASKGLGKAMALALGAAGVNLALVSRDKKLLDETAKETSATGVKVAAFQCDVTSEKQIQDLEKAVLKEIGAPQILINNAGINIRKNLVDFTLEEWNQVMETNLTGVFLVCRAFVPHMKGKGYGRIISMTSMMSHVALPGRTAYCSSKTGLLGFNRALALELAPEKITVNGISPGPFGTEINLPIFQNPQLSQQFLSKIPLGRWGEVSEIGKLAVFLCSEGAGYITGTDVVIDGGWTAQ